QAADPEYVSDVEAVRETDPLAVPDPASDVVAELLPDSAGDLPTDPFQFMEEEKKRDPRWMVGAAVSPLYSYRDAEAVAMSSNSGESGLLSYSTGVHVSYRRNSRLAFETGIYYNKTGIAIGAPGIKIFSQRQDNMVFGMGTEQAEITTMNNSVGNIVAYSGDIYMNGYLVNAESGPEAYNNVVADDAEAPETGIEQHLDYLELPFNLRYSVIDRTIELQLVGGMSTNFLISNYVTMEGPSGQEEIGYLSNVNTVNLSGNAGLGMIYHVGRKFSFLLEPRFRYFLNSVNDSSLPSTRPYSLGIYTGLSYTF
ncbi:MAG: outer membrane beta-barrel protein, partial [Bacteroidota bacterium]|nr:outer membrane beta-barrel protein [Bacteroidota bacterium]